MRKLSASIPKGWFEIISNDRSYEGSWF